MALDIRSLINPRALDLPEYDQKHVTISWQNEGRVQRLMSNESSYAPLESVQNAIRNYASKANWYPEDANYLVKFREKLAAYTGTAAENITVGNGSMELLDLVFQTLIGNLGVDEVIMPSPDYSAYTNRAKLFGAVVKTFPCGEDVDQVAGRIIQEINQNTKMLLFSRPNNPIGKVIPEKDLVTILRQGKLTVLDEAYVEMAAPGTSAAAWVKDWDNLIVLRSFSKGFGLAGLRLGYAVANPEIIRFINRVRHIFNVNLIALVAGEAALDDLESAMTVIEEIRQTRNWMASEIDRIPGLRVVPSEANFLMINVSGSGKKASQFVEDLFESGFLVRDFSKKYGLTPDQYFRITVGLPADMKRLVQALQKIQSPSP